MRTATVALVAVLMSAEAASQPSTPRYTRVEILPVVVPYGIVVPAEFRDALATNLVSEIERASPFQVVVAGGMPDDTNTLKLVTAITRFNPGNRDARAGIGLGVGATRMKVRARLVDARSCVVVSEGDAEGKVIGGWLGGDSLNATRAVAKDIAKVAARANRNAPAGGTSSCDPDDGVTAAGAADSTPSAETAALTAAAERGDAHAQRDLAIRYARGDGVPKNEARAVKWWKRAADAGDPAAQVELAIRYEMGWSLPIDQAAALSWAQKAAAQGDPNGLALMGVRYERGAGVLQSNTEAAQHYRAAAEQGQPRAMCYLGDMFMWGKGVDTSDLDAYRWHVAAVAAGDERCRPHGKISSKKLSPDARAAAESEGLELARRYAPSGSRFSRGR